MLHFQQDIIVWLCTEYHSTLDMRITDIHGFNVIWICCIKGNVAALQFLLEKYTYPLIECLAVRQLYLISLLLIALISLPLIHESP